jgi:6-pyruvoyltetrahydropterin/6-carboxytetrahydropterin synthase
LFIPGSPASRLAGAGDLTRLSAAHRRELDGALFPQHLSSSVFQIEVQADFSAAHALVIGGGLEPVHGHNWHITATLRGARLDDDGLLVDFHMVERHLRDIAAAFHNGNLNDQRPFRGGEPGALNPSAENVARHIAEELSGRIAGKLPPGIALVSVRITEAPGCAATYYPADKP